MARVAILIQADLKLIKKSPRVMLGGGRWMFESNNLNACLIHSASNGFTTKHLYSADLILDGPAVIELSDLEGDGGKVSIYARKLFD